MNRFLLAANCLLLAALLFVFFNTLYDKLVGRFHGGKSVRECLVSLNHFDFHYKEQPKNPEVVLVGDSMIRRADWDSLLGRVTYNRGIAGDLTECICRRIHFLKGIGAKVWFIQGGINDIGAGEEDGVVNYFEEMASFVKAEGNTPVINLPMYVSRDVNELYRAFQDEEKINARVDKVNQDLKEFALKSGIKFIDMNLILAKDHLLSREYTDDGLHLNEAGYALWAKEMNAILE